MPAQLQASRGLQRIGRKVKIGGRDVAFDHRVQGVGSSLDELLLRGRAWRAEVSDAATEATLERTIDGASTVILTVHDPHGTLLRSPLVRSRYDVALDGLSFRYLKLSRQDKTTLQLTHEARNAARMRITPGARKAMPDKLTRAEFCLSQVREVPGERIPFYCPELHTIQPIESSREAREALEGQKARREPGGLSRKSGITVKGEDADAEQLRNIEQVLDVGRSMKARRKVLDSSIMVGIAESLCRNLGFGDATSTGFFQQQSNGAWPASGDVGKDARGYFRVAIAEDKANPKQPIQMLCQNVQRSAYSDGSNYRPWIKEAKKAVDAYLGGAASEVAVVERKPFERKETESIWSSVGRLGQEVNWRRFESADIVYYIAEPTLMASAVRMNITDSTPGIEQVTFDADDGKPVNEVRVTALARAWACPPGTVGVLDDTLGPAAGRFVCSSIRSALGRDNVMVEATLRRPTEPKPEPAPEVEKRSMRSGATAAASGDADRFVRWAHKTLGVDEGTSKHAKWAAAIGYSTAVPWCSIYVAYGIKKVTGLPLPPEAAYSGAWLDWSKGRRVPLSKIKPGDIVVFDWGDGGRTDHVAIYVGHGNVIGGNQSDSVTKVPLQSSAVVGVVRCKAFE